MTTTRTDNDVHSLERVARFRDELYDLKRCLISLGYSEFQAVFGVSQYVPTYWRLFRSNASPRLRPAIDFFLLNESVDATTLNQLIGSSWQSLLDLGIANFVTETDVSIPRHSLLYCLGHIFFVDSPRKDPDVYFGDDSLGFLYHLAPARGATVLDLCSGSGIQALQSSLSAREVHAVEINPRGQQILAINAYMNGVANKLKIYGGSLFERIPATEVYDLIQANPPLVPFPNDLKYPFVGHGGSDGIAITRQIVQNLPTRLKPSGIAQIIGLAFSDGITLTIQEDFRTLAEEYQLDIILTVVNQLPLFQGINTRFEALALTAAAAGHDELTTVRSRLKDELLTRGISHMAPFFLLVKEGPGALRVQNFSRPRHDGFWAVFGV
jgi:release factor glutamine methyltransferase